MKTLKIVKGDKKTQTETNIANPLYHIFYYLTFIT